MTAIEYITRVHALCARPRGFSAMVKAYGFNPRKERDKECVLESMGDLVCGREELTDLDVQILEEAEASMKRSKK